MTYPEFNSDLLIAVEKPLTKIYVDEVLTKQLADSKLILEVVEIDKQESYSRPEWISSSTFINLYLSDKFLLEHFIPFSDDLKLFLDNLKNLIRPFTEVAEFLNKSDLIKKTRPFPTFSTFYKSKEDFRFQFLFEIDGDESDYINALIDVFKTVNIYNEPEENSIQAAIKKSYSQSNRIKYLLYIDKQWNVLNPLLEVGREINERYREGNDFRISKPTVIMHQDDFRKNFVLDNNWGLVFDALETMMIKPNDVSLYSNISDKNLRQAEKFYNETILPRHKQYHGSFPSLETQQEYYNYFELIIAALLFAYTSLEAFANICIPNGYEYLDEKDNTKTYSKEAIEKGFSLKDKFKKILKEILKTPDPIHEKWWQKFVDLEKLRDEIVHTKQSKSENRYSQLLSKRIFQTISIHKEIIRYYGCYISENKKELLMEFPYNFGYDDFFPLLADEISYKQIYRDLRNIPEK